MYGFAAQVAAALGINVLRLALYAGLATSVAAGAYGLKLHYIGVGRQQTLDNIASQNKETLADVEEAVAKVDTCRTLGRQWNTVDGVCD